MTREEAIKGLTSLLEVRRRWDDMQTMKDEIECLEMAIKALEKEAVLDKIRAEIVHLHDWAFSREEILRIIDKYMAESEEVWNQQKNKLNTPSI